MIGAEAIKGMLLYEDDDILVINKPAGIAVENASYTSPDLRSLLRTYLKGGEIYVVHRLDQPVGGILVFGKTSRAAAALSSQLAKGSMDKNYTALVCGEIPSDAGLLENEIAFDKKKGHAVVRDIRDAGPSGAPAARASQRGQGQAGKGGGLTWKEAKLSYKQTDDHELSIKLFTGRRHQIRVQLAHAGMPILGDVRYGGDPYSCLCLCASSLSFDHPSDGRRLSYTVEPSF